MSNEEIEKTRVETGPVQFDDDWPGVFFRGDNSFHYSMILSHIIEEVEKNEEFKQKHFFDLNVLHSLKKDLNSSSFNKMNDPRIITETRIVKSLK